MKAIFEKTVEEIIGIRGNFYIVTVKFLSIPIYKSCRIPTRKILSNKDLEEFILETVGKKINQALNEINTVEL